MKNAAGKHVKPNSVVQVVDVKDDKRTLTLYDGETEKHGDYMPLCFTISSTRVLNYFVVETADVILKATTHSVTPLLWTTIRLDEVKNSG